MNFRLKTYEEFVAEKDELATDKGAGKDVIDGQGGPDNHDKEKKGGQSTATDKGAGKEVIILDALKEKLSKIKEKIKKMDDEDEEKPAAVAEFHTVKNAVREAEDMLDDMSLKVSAHTDDIDKESDDLKGQGKKKMSKEDIKANEDLAASLKALNTLVQGSATISEATQTKVAAVAELTELTVEGAADVDLQVKDLMAKIAKGDVEASTLDELDKMTDKLTAK